MKSHCDMSIKNMMKNNKVRPRERDVTQEEMQSLLAKLKELVPNMPKNKKLSKLEIIQYVIDYIADLQIALETHPVTRPSVSNSSPGRQPLGILSPSTNSVVNTCAAQEASQTEKIPSRLGDMVVSTPRPVSC
ncbi:DNA-binding protein inhibitor ID-2-like [Centruroides vittatus]|uniref:DNA-binding protein inhibitor ID-2-like n=1 Tax=Centruroides vittatus TaxID=120091 RepID=UPI00350F8AA4